MKPLQIAICDDLEEERVILSRMLRNYARRQGLSLQVHFFVSGEELLQSVRRANACQVLFLDIYMPGISGVETARRLRAAGYGASIVFATTSTDHGVDSFEVRASDYLVKPFRQEEVDRALDWCLEHMPEPLRSLSVYAEGETQEFPLASVLYIEVLGHQSHIHTLRQTVVVRKSLDDLERAVDSPDFFRCHRSFLVNLNHAERIESSDFLMSDGARIPISSANLPRARNIFTDWIYRNAWEKG
ncbi:LytR/AlgR family response regulator transcription factor [Pseudoflavonifractor capillosus]|uniref:LytR/AlgR family response regulator transcription factor n=1 Tax=Pseudoflavonifractor capillosus TaxID=106588 RepID=UPI0019581AEB|nr:LytTR family DNA-binding domain-containing protein [Pseudoflavonifractor capillosus]MBM6680455.1 response regulator transcription factor [Pseudoflavonifractor capillosus]HJB53051.1 LytTR family DNA-binding domain-containing protein [Candidatus Oscillibacter pullicola]